jgi:hypothetical protein
MLYRFKSEVTADIIMLEPNGRQILEIIGKSADAKGIILPEQMSLALDKLEQAVQADLMLRENLKKALAKGEEVDSNSPVLKEAISLQQRALPFIDMLKRSIKSQTNVVWGV